MSGSGGSQDGSNANVDDGFSNLVAALEGRGVELSDEELQRVLKLLDKANDFVNGGSGIFLLPDLSDEDLKLMLQIEAHRPAAPDSTHALICQAVLGAGRTAVLDPGYGDSKGVTLVAIVISFDDEDDDEEDDEGEFNDGVVRA